LRLFGVNTHVSFHANILSVLSFHTIHDISYVAMQALQLKHR